MDSRLRSKMYATLLDLRARSTWDPSAFNGVSVSWLKTAQRSILGIAALPALLTCTPPIPSVLRNMSKDSALCSPYHYTRSHHQTSGPFLPTN